MDTRQLLGVADPQRKQTAKRTEENPNWAGRSKPGPSRIRLHLDAVDFDRVAVHGARNSHLVASVGHNLILVRNLIAGYPRKIPWRGQPRGRAAVLPELPRRSGINPKYRMCTAGPARRCAEANASVK